MHFDIHYQACASYVRVRFWVGVRVSVEFSYLFNQATRVRIASAFFKAIFTQYSLSYSAVHNKSHYYSLSSSRYYHVAMQGENEMKTSLLY